MPKTQPRASGVPRAAIYARVSSAGQRERHTIEGQLLVLRAYVAQQGWELVETYIDDGRSARTGKLEQREGFAALLRDVAARRFEVLAVVDIDRLTRTEDMLERAAILGPFQRAGVRIVTPSGGALDLRTFTGEMFVMFDAMRAAEENRVKSERIKAGRLRAIAAGRKPASPTPFGLAYDRVAGAWSIDPARAAIVREIYARVIAGESCNAIADDLDVRGAPRPRGPWSQGKVYMLARSRHVIGEWVADRRQRLMIAVPAILDEATWAGAQDALRVGARRGLRRTRHVYLLEGLAVCGACGAPMGIRSEGPRCEAAYICGARRVRRRGEPRCSAPLVAVADADGRLWDRIAAAIEAPELVERVRRYSEARCADRGAWAGDVAGYERRLGKLARAEKVLLARFREELITEEGLDRELAELARTRVQVAQQLELARRAATGPDPIADSPATWLALIREFTRIGEPAVRQRVVRTIVVPGARFEGHRIHVTLRVDERAGELGASDPSCRLVTGSLRRTESDDGLRIRLVA